MCGRFTQTSSLQTVAAAFGLTGSALTQAPHKPRYNIAPNHPVFGGIRQGLSKRAEVFTWGLVPSWAKDPAIGDRLINARSETAAEKPSFRGPLKNSRCIIASDGFYEWRNAGPGRGRQPFLIRLKSREPFALGGIWSDWTGPDGTEIRSCAILTTAPNALMKPIHERMPVIIPAGRIDEWLDHSRYEPARLAERFFVPYPEGEMEAFPVSVLVNSPFNDSPECAQPLPE